MRKFLRWSADCGAPAIHSHDDFDDLLCDYIHCLFDDGGSLSTGYNTIYGIEAANPRLRGAFKVSRQAMRGWANGSPARSYPPLTWPATVAIALRMMQNGAVLEGVATLVSFHCLLRVSEMTGLTRQDVAISDDSRMGVDGFPGALRIRQTKTTRRGRPQWVTIRDPQIAALLSSAVADLRPSQFVFPFTPDQFRRTLHRTCAELGISQEYVPHSLRHGGATLLHLQGYSLEDIMLIGRWLSSNSARNYIQAGPAMLLDSGIPREITELGRKLARTLLVAVKLACRR